MGTRLMHNCLKPYKQVDLELTAGSNRQVQEHFWCRLRDYFYYSMWHNNMLVFCILIVLILESIDGYNHWMLCVKFQHHFSLFLCYQNLHTGPWMKYNNIDFFFNLSFDLLLVYHTFLFPNKASKSPWKITKKYGKLYIYKMLFLSSIKTTLKMLHLKCFRFNLPSLRWA